MSTKQLTASIASLVGIIVVILLLMPSCHPDELGDYGPSPGGNMITKKADVVPGP